MQIDEIKKIFLLLMVLCSHRCIDGLKILGLFPLHGKSHYMMCEKLAKELAAKGHEIDVYNHFPQTKSIQNFNDISLKGTLPQIVNNMSYEMATSFQTPNMQYMVQSIGNSVCELMNTPKFQELFKSLKKNQPYDVVIIELFVSDCYLAWGRYLDVPLIGVMTSPLMDWYNTPLGNPMNTASTPGVWSNFESPMGFFDRLLNTLMYNILYVQFKSAITEQNKYVEQFFGPGMPDIRDLPKDIDLLLVNSHYSLGEIRPYTPAIINVGGLHINDDGEKLPNNVQKWLDESKDGCIYFSFGSMVRIETFPKPVLDAFYAAFKNIAPVRVLLKIAKPEVLPDGLPSNVMTQSWFNQMQVLKHKNMKAFVTHGGWGSCQESIYAGIPLIGIPLFGDQPININKLTRKNAAIMIKLDNITEEVFTGALKEVLYNPLFKLNAEKLSKEFNDRLVKPSTEAVFWVEYIARHGKGALRSPIVDMPWWQANLIDVYGFIIFVIMIVFYVFIIILRLLKKITQRSFTTPPKDKKKTNKVKKIN